MCVISFVGDLARDRWPQQPWYPQVVPATETSSELNIVAGVSEDRVRELIDEAKAEFEQMLDDLARAVRADREAGDELCGSAEKFDVLREVATGLGPVYKEALEAILEEAGVGAREG